MAPKASFLSGGFCIRLAILLLLLPLPWVMAAMTAAALHEICHYIAVILTGKKPGPFFAYLFGAKIQLPAMTCRQEFLCALAGPAGSLFLLLFARVFPKLAFCGLIQGLYNLIPIYPCDGGRALRCFLEWKFPPDQAKRFEAWAEALSMILLILLCIYAGIAWKLGWPPLALGAVCIVRIKISKIPCKV